MEEREDRNWIILSDLRSLAKYLEVTRATVGDHEG